MNNGSHETERSHTVEPGVWRRNFLWVLASATTCCREELWPLSWSIEPRNPDGNWPQQVQNWSHNDREFDLSMFYDGKWLGVAYFLHLFFLLEMYFPTLSRKKIEQFSPPESEPTLSIQRRRGEDGRSDSARTTILGLTCNSNLSYAC